MSLFKGAGVALITPFNKDKSVNYDELGRIIDRQIEGKTDALIVCGTTGEPATMTEEEKLSVIEFAVKRTAGRIPVIRNRFKFYSCCYRFFKKSTEAGSRRFPYSNSIL